MTQLLLKLFVKDREQINNPKVRQKYGLLAGFVGIFCNVLLFGVKLLAGFLTASIAITADALNNLSDAGSSFVTVAGFKLAAKPADPEHPFGHGRYEYISGLVISFLIMLMGVELFRTSLDKILHPEQVTFHWVSAGILLFSILLKLWMCLFQKKLSKILNSNTMRATAMDSISDIAATFAVFAGLLVSAFSGFNVDGYIGILVSLFILYAGFSSARDTVDDLLGQAPDADYVQAIREKVLSYAGIVGIHDLIVHNYGPNRTLISLHAEVPSDTDILKSHDTIDNIEKDLKEEFHCDTVIHMDPIQINDQYVRALHDRVKAMVKLIDPALNIHDFRVVRGETHTNLIFDAAVPLQFRLTDAELVDSITRAVKVIDPTYEAVIHVDKTLI